MSTKCQQICWHDSDTYCFCSIIECLMSTMLFCWSAHRRMVGWTTDDQVYGICWHVNKLSTNLLTFYHLTLTYIIRADLTPTDLFSRPARLGLFGIDHRWSGLRDLLTCQQIVNKFVDILLLDSHNYTLWDLIWHLVSFLSIHIWVIFGSR